MLSAGGSPVDDGMVTGKLQIVVLSMNNLSQPFKSQSCLKRSMPSEQRSAVEHQTHSKPMVFEMQVSQELNATHVGRAVKYIAEPLATSSVFLSTL